MRGLVFGVSVLLARPVSADDGTSNIIGGTSTQPGDHPTVVALTYTGSLSGVCTGILIDPEWVLTAAHCVQAQALQVSGQPTVTESIRINLDTVDVDADPGRVLRAIDTIPRNGFNVNVLGRRDIGLVRLETPVTDIVPSAVNLDAALAPIGITPVLMVGFGVTASGGDDDGAQFALAGRTSIACSTVTAGFPLSDEELLCFSQADNAGKCDGDSGGPSFATLGGVQTVIGLTSFSDRQCTDYGADTRTDAERNFLVTYLPQLDPCVTDEDCDQSLICSGGGCVKPPPTANPADLGATCTAPTDCISDQCVDGPDGMRCTKTCLLGDATSCPEGFECLETVDGPVCWPGELDGGGGGCCDAGPRRGAATWLLAIGVLVGVLRRSR